MMRVFIIVVIVLVIVVIGGTILLGTSSHSGEQFSPDGFQRRRFSYYEALGMRLTATDYFNNTGNLELNLVKNKWITSTGRKPKDKDWVTVSMLTQGTFYQSDAAILIDYLEMSNATGAIDLDRWNQANPGYAAVMWPEIQKVAEGNMYILIPDILHHMLDLSRQKNNPLPQSWLAQEDKTAAPPDDLTKEEKAAGETRQKTIGQQSLDPFLVQLYLTAGKAAQDAEQTKRARFCYEQVLRLAPGTQEAQQKLDQLPAVAEEEPAEEEASVENESPEDESKK
ncbi:hypothetical protein C5Y96_12110 [Blastopirellula marina]|uniref:Tetratricopeptide repeat protein n=1 Tax=Blastopirellula marina TaxID=124 RepID=A0A2S8FFZ7_9BACT|nr:MULTISPECIES: hypothetical protein [Pirellulaceae]PQO31095.1 hypothetical protein C5Y96_12110 [Blastopirellula marina]RCS51489.1 hypothetical protein DTL36_12120 [Bremerella cremea]